MLLMQLAVPSFNSFSGYRTFLWQLESVGRSFTHWRELYPLPAEETAVLDANDGAGWQLV